MGKKAVPQPDLTLRILPECGGQSRREGKYPAGAPELIVEVALSTTARDLGSKLRLYERMGVREYVVAMVSPSKLIWHEWTSGGFRIVEPDADGIYRSRCFPGLWLDPEALWLDRERLLAVLQEGLASAEHAEFVSRLAAAKH